MFISHTHLGKSSHHGHAQLVAAFMSLCGSQVWIHEHEAVNQAICAKLPTPHPRHAHDRILSCQVGACGSYAVKNARVSLSIGKRTNRSPAEIHTHFGN